MHFVKEIFGREMESFISGGLWRFLTRQAYTREKQRWLQHFQCWKRQPYLERPRTLRDEMVKQGYRSPNQLQARHWKLALNDAAETWDKYWQSIFVKVRLKISHLIPSFPP